MLRALNKSNDRDNTNANATRSDNIMPKATRSANSMPNATRSDNSMPNATRSDNIKPNATRSDNSMPNATRSANSMPNATRSDNDMPNATRSANGNRKNGTDRSSLSFPTSVLTVRSPARQPVFAPSMWNHAPSLPVSLSLSLLRIPAGTLRLEWIGLEVPVRGSG